MRRPLLVLAAAIAGVGLFTGGLAWLLDTPKAPKGAPPEVRLYLGLCATCHGVDGRGSWRATLFLVRPGDLTDKARFGATSDAYLFDLIKHGGAPIGRPGMPAFGSTLRDEEIRLLAKVVHELPALKSAP